MRLPHLADRYACTGCLACVDSCNRQAVMMNKGADGHFYVNVVSDKCIGCLRCEKVCAHIHQEGYGNNQKTSRPYAVYNRDVSAYRRATSGGVFPALASYFINQGGVVYGVTYSDGIHAVHKRISKIEEIEVLQGSKYEQSNLKGIYKQITEDLKQGLKVFFIGTGCQVAGVLSYFATHQNSSLLYTADLVCGGVPSSLLIEAFVNHHTEFSKIDAYRQKEKYVFSYINTNNQKVVCRKALPLDGFKSCLTNRYSCYNCEFVGLHRKSDWTIGDYWGDNAGKVRSLCLCHSERSVAILENLHNVELEIIDWQFALNNPRIVNGKAPFATRIERKLLGWCFKKLPYSVIEKIYGSEVKKTDVFWFMYKVYKYIRFKRYFSKSKHLAEQIINS